MPVACQPEFSAAGRLRGSQGLQDSRRKELIVEPTFEQKLIHYLYAVISQTSAVAIERLKPDWVPTRIRTRENLNHCLPPGEHGCETTVWGAIKVRLNEDSRYPVYIHECEILEMGPNVKKQADAARSAAAETAS